MQTLYKYVNYLLINTQDDSLGIIRIPYIVFNLFESVCWLFCGVDIFRRCMKNDGGRYELYYSLSYVAFGLGEVLEATGVTPLLLLFKGAALLAIIGFRKSIRTKYDNKYL